MQNGTLKTLLFPRGPVCSRHHRSLASAARPARRLPPASGASAGSRRPDPARPGADPGVRRAQAAARARAHQRAVALARQRPSAHQSRRHRGARLRPGHRLDRRPAGRLAAGQEVRPHRRGRAARRLGLGSASGLRAGGGRLQSALCPAGRGAAAGARRHCAELGQQSASDLRGLFRAYRKHHPVWGACRALCRGLFVQHLGRHRLRRADHPRAAAPLPTITPRCSSSTTHNLFRCRSTARWKVAPAAGERQGDVRDLSGATSRCASTRR